MLYTFPDWARANKKSVDFENLQRMLKEYSEYLHLPGNREEMINIFNRAKM